MVEAQDGALLIGRTVGNYIIRAKIGEGGMGVVYRAEHPQISRSVAIKVLHPGADRNPELVHRFFNEARAATQIRNEHIVEVLDFGELPDHAPYLVMEWLEGQSLGSLLLAETKLSVVRAAHILRGIIRALRAAHAKGVVHRDLKPDNVFLVPRDGESDLIKVLDFGIAKLMTAPMAGDYRTQTGALIGTPAYMSPEQCRGSKEIDARTDIYSLGVIGYQMLTGCMPFGAAALGELLFKHLSESPPTLESLDPSLPGPLCAVISRTLAKSPEARPSLAELSAALEAVRSSDSPLSGRVVVTGGTVLAVAEPRVGTQTTLASMAAQVRGPGRRVARSKLLAAALVVAGVAGAALVLKPRTVNSPAAPPAPAPIVPPVEQAKPAPLAQPTEGRRVVRIQIHTDPVGAHLEVDGRSGNPFVEAVAPDGRPHVVSASHPGFATVRQSISFDRDRDLTLSLAALPGEGPPSRPEPRPRNRIKNATKGTNETAGKIGETPATGPTGYRSTKLKLETEFPGP